MQPWNALSRNALRRIAIAAGLFAAFAASAAVVYKWTDSDGVVHYSDQAVPGAEKIVTSSGSTNGIGGGARPLAVTSNGVPASRLDTTVLKIGAPAGNQVFFGDEIVPVRLDSALKPNQSVTWSLNGQPLTDQAPDATAFALQGLPRGSYTLSAVVTDLITGASQSTDSVTFYVRQPSELSPQHKMP
jgi:hypothetical protein